LLALGIHGGVRSGGLETTLSDAKMQPLKKMKRSGPFRFWKLKDWSRFVHS
jgi:hypothetical protein